MSEKIIVTKIPPDLFGFARGEGEVLPDDIDPFLMKSLIRQRQNHLQRREAVELAIPALKRLADVLTGKSGQPYKVRGILYSLYNGKPFSVLEILGLDWEIRKDLAAVLLAFGFEDKKVKFFYDALKSAIVEVGQWDWFIEESRNIEQLEEYVKAAKEERSQP